MNVDKVDRAIIAQLSADSRLSVRALAERVHVSRSAVANRLQRLIADGVPRTDAFRLDPGDESQYTPDVATDRDGDVVFVWDGHASDANHSCRGRRQ